MGSSRARRRIGKEEGEEESESNGILLLQLFKKTNTFTDQLLKENSQLANHPTN